VNTETVSRKKKRDYQRFTLYPGNKDHKTSQAVDWGLRTPSTSNIFTRLQINFLLLSNIYIARVSTCVLSKCGGKGECKGFIVDWLKALKILVGQILLALDY
jgi:hypothetical protein